MLITLRTNMENQSWNATAVEPAGLIPSTACTFKNCKQRCNCGSKRFVHFLVFR